jgi:hypothetical protein
MKCKSRLCFRLTVLAASACLLSLVGAAFGADTTMNLGSTPNESTTQQSSILKKYDEDTQITDAKLKADAGSLSSVSLRFNLSYYGPSPTNLGELNQPNPDGVASATQTAISGTLGGRYRLSPSTTISLYAGVSDLYAFHPQQTLDLNSPTVSYDTTFRLAGIQFLSSPSVTMVTQQYYRSKGEAAGLAYYLAGVYNIGKSRFAVGAENSLGYYFFDRAMIPKDVLVRRVNLSLAPYLKYNFTEKLNVNTMAGFSLYNLRQAASPADLGTRLVTQKLALGYAVSRDIYVSPYLMFFPAQATIAETTINLLTSFSLL